MHAAGIVEQQVLTHNLRTLKKTIYILDFFEKKWIVNLPAGTLVESISQSIKTAILMVVSAFISKCYLQRSLEKVRKNSRSLLTTHL